MQAVKECHEIIVAAGEILGSGRLEGDAVDLRKLPIITSWPGDAGPFITLPMVITRDPETGIQNVGYFFGTSLLNSRTGVASP